jgi:hypothetical protein
MITWLTNDNQILEAQGSVWLDGLDDDDEWLLSMWWY